MTIELNQLQLEAQEENEKEEENGDKEKNSRKAREAANSVSGHSIF